MDLIDTPEQASPEWVTAALRTADLDATVTSVTVRPVGTGQMSGTYMLELGGTSAPARIVLKVASSERSTRTRASTAYRAEVGFYRDLAAAVAMRVPASYLAIIDDDGTRFNLLLEDVSPAEQGDQIAGAEVDVVTVAARNLAGLHASTWCDDTLWQRPWLVRTDAARARVLRSIYDASATTFAQRFADRLDPVHLQTILGIGEHIEPFLLDRQTPFAAVHGDYRLDNLLIAPTGEVIAVDWQTVTVGLPGRDLAYLISTSLSVDDRRLAEREIVAAYHRALIDGGVSLYDLDACFDDYVFGLLQSPMIIVIGAAYSDPTERGDRMFSVMAERALTAIADHRRLNI